MAVPQEKSLITPEEYLRRERAALDKSEFFGGEIFAMAGASPQHALLSMRVLVQLGSLLRGHPCTPYNNRLPDGTWRLTPVRGVDAAAPLQSLGVSLPLSEVYEGVEFPPVVSLKPAEK